MPQALQGPPKPLTRRASWKGEVRINLVAFKVAAFNAFPESGGDLHFHQLHAPSCHAPIHYQKICPTHGPVGNDEILTAYEYSRGKYVEFQPEELDRLRTMADRSLVIDTFIAPKQLDPIFLDGRTYYLAPEGAEAQEPYAVFREVMENMNRQGIGRVVFSEREQLALVRSLDGVLTMSMLHHQTELLPPLEVAPSKQRTKPRNRELAEKLIKMATPSRFDFSRFEDRYRERLLKLIQSKIAGREIVPPQEEEQPKVINLMDALKKSIAQAGHERGPVLARDRNGTAAHHNGQGKAGPPRVQSTARRAKKRENRT